MGAGTAAAAAPPAPTQTPSPPVLECNNAEAINTAAANAGGNSINIDQSPTAGTTPPQPQVPTNTDIPPTATVPATPVATAPMAEAESALESCLSDPGNETDITGTMSGDDQHDNMDIEKVVSAIPKEQRDGVRSLLEQRKIRRMRQLQRRRKKPAADEPALPRNPQK